jgi:hypothetical protein
MGVSVFAQSRMQVCVLSGRAESGDEFIEPLCGDRIEESVAIGEVAQRGAVTDAGPLGEPPKCDRLRALRRQQLAGRTSRREPWW